MTTNNRKIVVKLVQSDKPLDLFPIAVAIANSIQKRGVEYERRSEVSRTVERNRANH